MKSAALLFGQVIDCRTIELSGTFFHFTKDMGAQLAKSFYRFVQTLFGHSCVLDWRLNDRKIKDDNQFENSPSRLFDRYNNLGIDLIGDIKSDRVYNKSTLLMYSKDILYRLPLYKNIPPFCSVDFSQYAEKEIDPFSASPQMLRSAILKTFALEGKVNKAFYEHHDIEGKLLVSSDYVEQEQYSGDFCLRISLYSIQNELIDYSEKLYQYGSQITTQFRDVNAVIRISQSQERGYFSYFIGLKVPPIIARDSNMDRNAYHRYLGDIGWTTFLSPYTTKIVNLDGVKMIDQRSTLTIKQMDNGGLCVQNKRNLEETTIQDLKNMRKLIYNAVYPGKGVFPLSFRNWRSHWEDVPVFDEEVQIQNNNVLFCSLNVADMGFVLG